MASLLPPNAKPFERALEDAANELADVPVPLRHLWNPATCPADMLPWLAWGVSIDFWSSEWTEAVKRTAIAGAIDAQRRKGTPASLREVLDRFDPLIAVVEWFDDTANLDPHEFRLELPLATETAVSYNEATVSALLRDIAAVKPLRSHMLVVHRLQAQAHAGLLSVARTALYTRLDGEADTDAAGDPVWASYLQTELGEPLQLDSGEFLENT